MKIGVIYLVFLIKSSESVNNYPTRRWLNICKSSTMTEWYENKSSRLAKYLKENLDVLYL